VGNVNWRYEQCAESCFRDPGEPRTATGTHAYLYALRQDIAWCLGRDVVSGRVNPRPALWPGAMAILAGIDLLGEYQAGNDDSSEVGRRFKAFLQDYFLLDTDSSETVYQLRNALLHSFGLYSKKRTREYVFQIVHCGLGLLAEIEPGLYQVDIGALHRAFEQAIARYREDVEKSPALQERLARMFQHYGVMVTDHLPS
jgi:hypothetical protein